MTTAHDRTQTLTDMMDPARSQALLAVLGDDALPAAGDPLPPFAHHLHFWAVGPQAADLLPDLGLPDRQVAAGRLVLHAPLLAGVRAERISRIEGITRKDGRAGPMAVVRLRHDIRQRQALALSEWQDLVYRPAGAPVAEPAPGEEMGPATLTLPLTDGTTLLPRYAALTLAPRPPAAPWPVPLLALLLARLAHSAGAAEGRPLTRFAYRALTPVAADAAARLCWRDGRVWLQADTAGPAIIGEAG